jgi:hypothetical protein
MARLKVVKQGVNESLVFTSQDNVKGSITYNGSTFSVNKPIAVDTVSERTSAAGVTIDGVLLKDGGFSIGSTAALGAFLNAAPAATGAGLKIHTHLNQNNSGGATYDYTYMNEFKGEFVSTSGTMVGVGADYVLQGTGTGAMCASSGYAKLKTGITLSGTAYPNLGTLTGGQFFADVFGVLSGTGVTVSGLYAGIGPCTAGTLTTAQYVSAIWGDYKSGVTLGTGDSSILLLTKAGASVVDYGILMPAVGDGSIGVGISIAAATTTALSITGASTNAIVIAGGTSNQLAITATAGAKGFAVTSTVQTANDLCTITTSTAVSSAAVMKALDISMTSTGASGVNMLEVARFTLTTAVEVGVWANAVVGKLDFSTTGFAHGLAGAICAEVDMPSTDPSGGQGTYTCYEAELGIPNAFTSSVATSFINMNVWGIGGSGGVGAFLDYGYIFDITGLGSAANSHVFQANSDQATHALRIRIDGVPYYMLLTSVANGTE